MPIGNALAVIRGVIKQVVSSCMISNYAGSTAAGSSVGGGYIDTINTNLLSVDARFVSPSKIVFDSSDNLYVADSTRIRKITPDGVVSTVAGSILDYKLTGNGYIDCDSFQNIYSIKNTTTTNGSIHKLNSNTGILSYVQGGYISPGNLFVDKTNNKIVITPAGYIYQYDPITKTSVYMAGSVYIQIQDGAVSPGASVGTGGAMISYIGGIKKNSSGEYIFTDLNRLRKLTYTNYTTFAGGKITTIAIFPGSNNNGGAIALDSSNNAFILTDSSTIIRKYIGATGSVFSTLGFTSGDMCIDSSDNIYVTDTAGRTIKKITPAGVMTIFAGDGTFGNTDGIGTDAKFSNPTYMCIDSSDNLYVWDVSSMRKITPSGVVSTIQVFENALHHKFIDPVVTIGLDCYDNLYAADRFCIKKILSGGISIFSGNPISSGNVNGNKIVSRFGTGVDTIGANNANGLYAIIPADSNGGLYVTDPSNTSIRLIDKDGIVSLYKQLTEKPCGITKHSNGDLYCSSPATNNIIKIEYGTKNLSYYTGQTTAGLINGDVLLSKFNTPTSLSFDLNDNLYVCDYSNYRIRKITPSGTVSDLAGIGSVAPTSIIDGPVKTATTPAPIGIAINSKNNIFFTSSTWYCIRGIYCNLSPVTFDIVISSNTFGFNLKAELLKLGWVRSQIFSVTVTINSGVLVGSLPVIDPTLYPASFYCIFQTGEYTNGSIISVINNGDIIGRGGSGNASGGTAFATGVKVDLKNNGRIAGGGGGGGTLGIGAGGGGAGSPFGLGGPATVNSNFQGLGTNTKVYGSAGGNGTLTTGGAGGIATSSPVNPNVGGNGYYGGNGGAGGNLGLAGTASSIWFGQTSSGKAAGNSLVGNSFITKDPTGTGTLLGPVS